MKLEKRDWHTNKSKIEWKLEKKDGSTNKLIMRWNWKREVKILTNLFAISWDLIMCHVPVYYKNKDITITLW